ncbi:Ribosomal RNA small subunit methyltransferase G [Rubripirellula obstinata]|uniref:Ribosomal RNA small subunit methyltransferase G n=1 Tax=Rubripirellula obstinata TaxID=406547 RepID=A0A5B1CG64_9BACT|nr:16S rRNA (guanine(527)-N(7))-methyltransferase RsmG [Rubripirellula obstinata]KAA1258729.1 Ribosomal RNA small subunit methyltransferase G [Rubripirellula obstinata]
MPIDPDFAAALAAHKMEIDEPIALRLQQFAEAMWKLNENLNLTRHTTWDLFVGRDLRDCLQLSPLIEPGEEVLDLGSGNGIPGIPLAILRGDIEVSLAESVAKRAGALNEIIAELGLPVAVYAARGEDLLDDFRFSTIVSRAVGSIAKFCRWVEPHWTSVDRLLLIKGPKWVDERGEARHLGLLATLELRRLASYPLGDTEESEGVILQVMTKWRAKQLQTQAAEGDPGTTPS